MQGHAGVVDPRMMHNPYMMSPQQQLLNPYLMVQPQQEFSSGLAGTVATTAAAAAPGIADGGGVGVGGDPIKGDGGVDVGNGRIGHEGWPAGGPGGKGIMTVKDALAPQAGATELTAAFVNASIDPNSHSNDK